MRIVRFGQMLDLRNGGEFVSSFEVEVEGGRTAVVTTTEETLQQLIRLAAGLGQTLEEALQHVSEPEYGDEEIPEAVFGGDDPGEMLGGEESPMGRISDEEVMKERVVVGVIEAAKPVRRPHVDADGFFKPPSARTVETDEMGYPIVPQTRTTPPAIGEEDDGDQI